ncbi:hypothetical protein KAI12_03745, partial [Candidatus Bathyarchaeota archaeon]|nr:hypothetical protein [Candidatus Bathyarchaeota archaeon]
MPYIQKEIMIDSPMKKVWSVIVKHLERPELQGEDEPKGPIQSRYGIPLSKQRKGVGTKTRWIYQLRTRKFVWDDVVTEWKENEKITWEATSAWEMKDSFILSLVSDKKMRLSYTMDYILPYGILGKIYDRILLRKSMEKYLEETLRQMKK